MIRATAIMTKLRNRIPGILKAKGMSMRALHIAADLPWPTVHRVATEDPMPPRTNIHTLVTIAHTLDVRVDDLYEVEKD